MNFFNLKQKCKSGAISFLHLLFPPNYTCDICGDEIFSGKNLCENCLLTIRFNNANTCPVCGRQTLRPEICLECKEDAPLFKRAASPFVYGDGAAILIAKFKKGKAYLKEYFADHMAPYVNDLPPVDGIVYVPMSDKSERNRGYNQAKLLADAISERTGIPVYDNVIQKRKDTNEQKSLGKRERAENLKGCFHIHERKFCQNKTLLLIDDVLTTGATANEVSRLLLGADATAVYLLTIASVPYKSPTQKHTPASEKSQPDLSQNALTEPPRYPLNPKQNTK